MSTYNNNNKKNNYKTNDKKSKTLKMARKNRMKTCHKRNSDKTNKAINKQRNEILNATANIFEPPRTHTHPLKKQNKKQKKYAMNLLVVFCGIYGQIASTKLIF